MTLAIAIFAAITATISFTIQSYQAIRRWREDRELMRRARSLTLEEMIEDAERRKAHG